MLPIDTVPNFLFHAVATCSPNSVGGNHLKAVVAGGRIDRYHTKLQVFQQPFSCYSCYNWELLQINWCIKALTILSRERG